MQLVQPSQALSLAGRFLRLVCAEKFVKCLCGSWKKDPEWSFPSRKAVIQDV